LAECLADHPELRDIVEQWPRLPEPVRAAMRALASVGADSADRTPREPPSR
jgi:hypothetical protein